MPSLPPSAKAGGFLAAIRVHARSRDKERKHVLRLHSRQPQTQSVYIGVTDSLPTRLDQQVEEYASPQDAITHQKQLENWHRDWKIQLIEKGNLGWSDLSDLI